MKELLRRLLTGIVYVVLLLSTAYLNSDAFDFLFMAFGLGCLYEFKRIVEIKGYYIFIAYLALWWAYIYLIHTEIPVLILLVITLIIDIALLGYLFTKTKQKFKKLELYLIGIFYISGGFIFLTMIPYNQSEFAKFLIMGIFILIWVSDSFAYLVGKSIGRTKLFPSVSPKKTIEGSLGGLIFAMLAGYLLSFYENSITSSQWLILAFIIVLTGGLGDLLQSKFKRVAGVKDSGAILPGHGGIWDRLDSLVFAAPFAYLTLKLFFYVS
ncbi:MULTISPECIES: phosphatidate cytidylyltransferase [Croceitalea]|uniref:Phosphatidate cytidylyltransferase n=1 Tax=Croceitalea vernalis TaxID=3075599 RepID=A0ABU3BL15_9FLAO|nr:MULTISPECIES: phosphatidate cytidylyltransferase [unclassified Croceitalea]MDT0541012.1 phosphatidate cytidylyltransferase [Croceitalea sp. P059]MDT0622861.1 phosphatidate cytidylyltransferase [Croceitalea sp. P007]